ncbi:hypothetical protein GCM10010912_29610 [Paenibacillus albidus]|uniref:Uncharacterized protein n=1 Tax=Paenibacillus albidus TaxID=2041023 RepID=A0A917CAW4_9BACL|nr:hypothetical protein [Paenibacillus albidus]GGF82585.1 hypothetical protein GCM10010912_29610 [Paenibacillus albidus]
MEITTLIAMLAAISGIALGWVTRTSAYKKDVAQEAGTGAALRTDVEYIKRGVDDIRADVRVQGKRTDQLAERVTRAEERINQVQKKVDKLEE